MTATLSANWVRPFNNILYVDAISCSILSTESAQRKEKSKIAYAIIRMPDGKEHEIPLPPKTFSSGRVGYYAQIPSFVFEDEVYGGQIQIWKKQK